MNIEIRKAKEIDAGGIVLVYTYTWETTYKGLIPDEILENRRNTIEDRIPTTANSIKEKDNAYVAVDGNKIVGIMTYGKSRDNNYPDSGEIYSIYVLKEYQGLGIGKDLFMNGIKELINKGYNNMILNVLIGNKTINFYEKYSGIKVGQRQDNFGTTVLTENIMYFDNLKDIYLRFRKEDKYE